MLEDDKANNGEDTPAEGGETSISAGVSQKSAQTPAKTTTTPLFSVSTFVGETDKANGKSPKPTQKTNGNKQPIFVIDLLDDEDYPPTNASTSAAATKDIVSYKRATKHRAETDLDRPADRLKQSRNAIRSDQPSTSGALVRQSIPKPKIFGAVSSSGILSAEIRLYPRPKEPHEYVDAIFPHVAQTHRSIHRIMSNYQFSRFTGIDVRKVLKSRMICTVKFYIRECFRVYNDIIPHSEKCRKLARHMARIMDLIHQICLAFVRDNIYLYWISQLVAIYISLELSYANHTKSYISWMVNRIIYLINKHLVIKGNLVLTKSNLLRMFFYIPDMFEQRNIILPIIKTFLPELCEMHKEQVVLEDKVYVKYLTILHQWMRMETDPADRTELLANWKSYMCPAPSLFENSKYINFLPKVSARVSATKEILSNLPVVHELRRAALIDDLEPLDDTELILSDDDDFEDFDELGGSADFGKVFANILLKKRERKLLKCLPVTETLDLTHDSDINAGNASGGIAALNNLKNTTSKIPQTRPPRKECKWVYRMRKLCLSASPKEESITIISDSDSDSNGEESTTLTYRPLAEPVRFNAYFHEDKSSVEMDESAASLDSYGNSETDYSSAESDDNDPSANARGGFNFRHLNNLGPFLGPNKNTQPKRESGGSSNSTNGRYRALNSETTYNGRSRTISAKEKTPIVIPEHRLPRIVDNSWYRRDSVHPYPYHHELFDEDDIFCDLDDDNDEYEEFYSLPSTTSLNSTSDVVVYSQAQKTTMISKNIEADVQINAKPVKKQVKFNENPIGPTRRAHSIAGIKMPIKPAININKSQHNQQTVFSSPPGRFASPCSSTSSASESLKQIAKKGRKYDNINDFKKRQYFYNKPVEIDLTVSTHPIQSKNTQQNFTSNQNFTTANESSIQTAPKDISSTNLNNEAIIIIDDDSIDENMFVTSKIKQVDQDTKVTTTVTADSTDYSNSIVNEESPLGENGEGDVNTTKNITVDFCNSISSSSTERRNYLGSMSQCSIESADQNCISDCETSVTNNRNTNSSNFLNSLPTQIAAADSGNKHSPIDLERNTEVATCSSGVIDTTQSFLESVTTKSLYNFKAMCADSPNQCKEYNIENEVDKKASISDVHVRSAYHKELLAKHIEPACSSTGTSFAFKRNVTDKGIKISETPKGPSFTSNSKSTATSSVKVGPIVDSNELEKSKGNIEPACSSTGTSSSFKRIVTDKGIKISETASKSPSFASNSKSNATLSVKVDTVVDSNELEKSNGDIEPACSSTGTSSSFKRIVTDKGIKISETASKSPSFASNSKSNATLSVKVDTVVDSNELAKSNGNTEPACSSTGTSSSFKRIVTDKGIKISETASKSPSFASNSKSNATLSAKVGTIVVSNELEKSNGDIEPACSSSGTSSSFKRIVTDKGIKISETASKGPSFASNSKSNATLSMKVDTIVNSNELEKSNGNIEPACSSTGTSSSFKRIVTDKGIKISETASKSPSFASNSKSNATLSVKVDTVVDSNELAKSNGNTEPACSSTGTSSSFKSNVTEKGIKISKTASKGPSFASNSKNNATLSVKVGTIVHSTKLEKSSENEEAALENESAVKQFEFHQPNSVGNNKIPSLETISKIPNEIVDSNIHHSQINVKVSNSKPINLQCSVKKGIVSKQYNKGKYSKANEFGTNANLLKEEVVSSSVQAENQKKKRVDMHSRARHLNYCESTNKISNQLTDITCSENVPHFSGTGSSSKELSFRQHKSNAFANVDKNFDFEEQRKIKDQNLTNDNDIMDLIEKTHSINQNSSDNKISSSEQNADLINPIDILTANASVTGFIDPSINRKDKEENQGICKTNNLNKSEVPETTVDLKQCEASNFAKIEIESEIPKDCYASDEYNLQSFQGYKIHNLVKVDKSDYVEQCKSNRKISSEAFEKNTSIPENIGEELKNKNYSDTKGITQRLLNENLIIKQTHGESTDKKYVGSKSFTEGHTSCESMEKFIHTASKNIASESSSIDITPRLEKGGDIDIIRHKENERENMFSETQHSVEILSTEQLQTDSDINMEIPTTHDVLEHEENYNTAKQTLTEPVENHLFAIESTVKHASCESTEKMHPIESKNIEYENNITSGSGSIKKENLLPSGTTSRIERGENIDVSRQKENEGGDIISEGQPSVKILSTEQLQMDSDINTEIPITHDVAEQGENHNTAKQTLTERVEKKLFAIESIVEHATCESTEIIHPIASKNIEYENNITSGSGSIKKENLLPSGSTSRIEKSGNIDVSHQKENERENMISETQPSVEILSTEQLQTDSDKNTEIPTTHEVLEHEENDNTDKQTLTESLENKSLCIKSTDDHASCESMEKINLTELKYMENTKITSDSGSIGKGNLLLGGITSRMERGENIDVSRQKENELGDIISEAQPSVRILSTEQLQMDSDINTEIPITYDVAEHEENDNTAKQTLTESVEYKFLCIKSTDEHASCESTGKCILIESKNTESENNITAESGSIKKENLLLSGTPSKLEKGEKFDVCFHKEKLEKIISEKQTSVRILSTDQLQTDSDIYMEIPTTHDVLEHEENDNTVEQTLTESAEKTSFVIASCESLEKVALTESTDNERESNIVSECGSIKKENLLSSDMQKPEVEKIADFHHNESERKGTISEGQTPTKTLNIAQSIIYSEVTKTDDIEQNAKAANASKQTFEESVEKKSLAIESTDEHACEPMEDVILTESENLESENNVISECCSIKKDLLSSDIDLKEKKVEEIDYFHQNENVGEDSASYIQPSINTLNASKSNAELILNSKVPSSQDIVEDAEVLNIIKQTSGADLNPNYLITNSTDEHNYCESAETVILTQSRSIESGNNITSEISVIKKENSLSSDVDLKWEKIERIDDFHHSESEGENTFSDAVTKIHDIVQNEESDKTAKQSSNKSIKEKYLVTKTSAGRKTWESTDEAIPTDSKHIGSTENYVLKCGGIEKDNLLHDDIDLKRKKVEEIEVFHHKENEVKHKICEVHPSINTLSIDERKTDSITYLEVSSSQEVCSTTKQTDQEPLEETYLITTNADKHTSYESMDGVILTDSTNIESKENCVLERGAIENDNLLRSDIVLERKEAENIAEFQHKEKEGENKISDVHSSIKTLSTKQSELDLFTNVEVPVCHFIVENNEDDNTTKQTSNESLEEKYVITKNRDEHISISSTKQVILTESTNTEGEDNNVLECGAIGKDNVLLNDISLRSKKVEDIYFPHSIESEGENKISDIQHLVKVTTGHSKRDLSIYSKVPPLHDIVKNKEVDKNVNVKSSRKCTLDDTQKIHKSEVTQDCVENITILSAVRQERDRLSSNDMRFGGNLPRGNKEGSKSSDDFLKTNYEKLFTFGNAETISQKREYNFEYDPIAINTGGENKNFSGSEIISELGTAAADTQLSKKIGSSSDQSKKTGVQTDFASRFTEFVYSSYEKNFDFEKHKEIKDIVDTESSSNINLSNKGLIKNDFLSNTQPKGTPGTHRSIVENTNLRDEIKSHDHFNVTQGHKQCGLISVTEPEHEAVCSLTSDSETLSEMQSIHEESILHPKTNQIVDSTNVSNFLDSDFNSYSVIDDLVKAVNELKPTVSKYNEPKVTEDTEQSEMVGIIRRNYATPESVDSLVIKYLKNEVQLEDSLNSERSQIKEIPNSENLDICYSNEAYKIISNKQSIQPQLENKNTAFHNSEVVIENICSTSDSATKTDKNRQSKRWKVIKNTAFREAPINQSTNTETVEKSHQCQQEIKIKLAKSAKQRGKRNLQQTAKTVPKPTKRRRRNEISLLCEHSNVETCADIDTDSKESANRPITCLESEFSDTESNANYSSVNFESEATSEFNAAVGNNEIETDKLLGFYNSCSKEIADSLSNITPNLNTNSKSIGSCNVSSTMATPTAVLSKSKGRNISHSCSQTDKAAKNTNRSRQRPLLYSENDVKVDSLTTDKPVLDRQEELDKANVESSDRRILRSYRKNKARDQKILKSTDSSTCGRISFKTTERDQVLKSSSLLEKPESPNLPLKKRRNISGVTDEEEASMLEETTCSSGTNELTIELSEYNKQIEEETFPKQLQKEYLSYKDDKMKSTKSISSSSTISIHETPEFIPAKKTESGLAKKNLRSESFRNAKQRKVENNHVKENASIVQIAPYVVPIASETIILEELRNSKSLRSTCNTKEKMPCSISKQTSITVGNDQEMDNSKMVTYKIEVQDIPKDIEIANNVVTSMQEELPSDDSHTNNTISTLTDTPSQIHTTTNDDTITWSLVGSSTAQSAAIEVPISNTNYLNLPSEIISEIASEKCYTPEQSYTPEQESSVVVNTYVASKTETIPASYPATPMRSAAKYLNSVRLSSYIDTLNAAIDESVMLDSSTNTFSGVDLHVYEEARAAILEYANGHDRNSQPLLYKDHADGTISILNDNDDGQEWLILPVCLSKRLQKLAIALTTLQEQLSPSTIFEKGVTRTRAKINAVLSHLLHSHKVMPIESSSKSQTTATAINIANICRPPTIDVQNMTAHYPTRLTNIVPKSDEVNLAFPTTTRNDQVLIQDKYGSETITSVTNYDNSQTINSENNNENTVIFGIDVNPITLSENNVSVQQFVNNFETNFDENNWSYLPPAGGTEISQGNIAQRNVYQQVNKDTTAIKQSVCLQDSQNSQPDVKQLIESPSGRVPQSKFSAVQQREVNRSEEKPKQNTLATITETNSYNQQGIVTETSPAVNWKPLEQCLANIRKEQKCFDEHISAIKADIQYSLAASQANIGQIININTIPELQQQCYQNFALGASGSVSTLHTNISSNQSQMHSYLSSKNQQQFTTNITNIRQNMGSSTFMSGMTNTTTEVYQSITEHKNRMQQLQECPPILAQRQPSHFHTSNYVNMKPQTNATLSASTLFNTDINTQQIEKSETSVQAFQDTSCSSSSSNLRLPFFKRLTSASTSTVTTSVKQQQCCETGYLTQHQPGLVQPVLDIYYPQVEVHQTIHTELKLQQMQQKQEQRFREIGVIEREKQNLQLHPQQPIQQFTLNYQAPSQVVLAPQIFTGVGQHAPKPEPPPPLIPKKRGRPPKSPVAAVGSAPTLKRRQITANIEKCQELTNVTQNSYSNEETNTANSTVVPTQYFIITQLPQIQQQTTNQLITFVDNSYVADRTLNQTDSIATVTNYNQIHFKQNSNNT